MAEQVVPVPDIGDFDAVTLATAEADAAGTDELAAAAAVLNDLDIGTPGYGRDITRAVAPHLVLDGLTTLAIHGIALTDELDAMATSTSAGIAGPTALSPLLDAIATFFVQVAREATIEGDALALAAASAGSMGTPGIHTALCCPPPPGPVETRATISSPRRIVFTKRTPFLIS